MKKTFVFRVNYNEAHSWIIDELNKGRLRQGWGLADMAISFDGHTISFSQWKEKFPSHWNEGFESIRSRYEILSRMLEIDVGDLIIVPKSINSYTFSIARAKSKYLFQVNESNMWGDFGHYIEVDDVKHYSYRCNADSILISSKFRAYQSAINNVYKKEVIESCDKLHLLQSDTKSRTNEALWTEILEESIKESHTKILKRVSPIEFENLIASSLEKSGYVIIGRNEYDGKGSDVDIAASYLAPFFSGLIDGITSRIDLLIQIKKKGGKDNDFREGVDQLVKARQSGRIGELILINTSDEISLDDYAYANLKDVNVIDGSKILRLILTTKFENVG